MVKHSNILDIEMSAPRDSGLPGLPIGEQPPYRRVFFGAEKEWTSNEQGWQKVVGYMKRPQHHARRQELMRRRAREESSRNANA